MQPNLNFIAVILLIFITQIPISAQNNFDTAYINRLNKRSHVLLAQDRDSSAFLAKKAIELSEKLNYTYGLGDGYTKLGLLEKNAGNYDQALVYYRKSLFYRKQLNDDNLVAKVYTNMGNVFQKTGVYDSAIYFHLQALKIAENENNLSSIADYSNNLGIAFDKNENYIDALKYHNKSFEVSSTLNDTSKIIRSLINKGSVLVNMKEFDKALDFLMMVLSGFSSNVLPQDMANALNNIAIAYQNKSQIDSALFYFDRARIIFKEIESPSLADCLSNLGVLYVEQKEYSLAIQYLKESNALCEHTGNIAVLSNNFLNLAFAHIGLGSSEEAYTNLNLHLLYEDSVVNENKNAKIAELQTQYETEKKEKQILLQQKDIQRGKTIRSIIIGGSILLLSILILLFNRRQLKRKLEFEKKLVDDRIRISSDLHDDIGSTLGSISYFSQLANMQTKDNNSDQLNELLTKISEVSQEAVDNMGDIVWTINPGNDDAEKMLLRMNNYASDILASANIRYEVENTASLEGLNLSMVQRKNIFLIFKEAIYNAAKYAQCSVVHVYVWEEENILNFKIYDNGIGFKMENNVSYNGNGLKNMRSRAKEMKGILNISTEQGKGTNILVSLKL